MEPRREVRKDFPIRSRSRENAASNGTVSLKRTSAVPSLQYKYTPDTGAECVVGAVGVLGGSKVATT